jgi:hypothetical protein
MTRISVSHKAFFLIFLLWELWKNVENSICKDEAVAKETQQQQ